MSDTTKFTPSPAFDRAAQALDIGVESFWFNQYPAEHAGKLEARVKMAAKLLGKAADLRHSQALDAVAQALRFPAWHHLAAHLGRVVAFKSGPLPAGWLDALSATVVLAVVPEDDVTLPASQLDAFEAFGGTLAMLTDSPKQRVLDGVSAALCGGNSWREVRARSPLNAVEPLYHFQVFEQDAEGGVGGCFELSPACRQLVDELDDRWQGYDDFTKPQKKRARAWLESVLVAQPGFLEGGLALAWMQRDAKEEEATRTVAGFVRAAEALIPKGFKGKLRWGHVENRFYHRLLWLQMSLNHDRGASEDAAKVARKLLRLNPGDNLGVRYVLPFLQLEQGEVGAARRSLKAIADEPGLTAAATRAFVAFAEDNLELFRREMVTALFTLPVMRSFLLNDPKALQDAESGYRQVRPDMETFAEFAWAKSMEAAREVAASFSQSKAFHDLVVNGIAPDGSFDWSNTGMVRALSEAIVATGTEGWARLSDARDWMATHDAEQTPEKYGCRSWQQAVSESRLFDLQYRASVDGRREAWIRKRRSS